MNGSELLRDTATPPSLAQEDSKSGRKCKLVILVEPGAPRKIGPALGAEIRPVLGAQPKKKHFNFYDVRFR